MSKLKELFKSIIAWSIFIIIISVVGFIVFGFIRVKTCFKLADAFLSLCGGLIASGLLTLLVELIHRCKEKKDAQIILSPFLNDLLDFFLNVSAIYLKQDYEERTYDEWIDTFIDNIDEEFTRNLMINKLQRLSETASYQFSLLDSYRNNKFSTEEHRSTVKWFKNSCVFLKRQIESYDILSNYNIISDGLKEFAKRANKLSDNFSAPFQTRYNLPKQFAEELEKAKL